MPTRLDGIYTTCIDCWLDINIHQLLRFEELDEQIELAGELYKTGVEEKIEGEVEKEIKQDTKEEIEDEQGQKPKRLRLSLRFKGKK
ncbi:MAG: hypothetical protein M1839_000033 [Geoglossum umbratile]|nr:MAG: hypothetical protein M1839_000033 [Geoglossum umbratile]